MRVKNNGFDWTKIENAAEYSYDRYGNEVIIGDITLADIRISVYSQTVDGSSVLPVLLDAFLFRRLFLFVLRGEVVVIF